jgi:hypothetical protein
MWVGIFILTPIVCSVGQRLSGSGVYRAVFVRHFYPSWIFQVFIDSTCPSLFFIVAFLTRFSSLQSFCPVRSVCFRLYRIIISAFSISECIKSYDVGA